MIEPFLCRRAAWTIVDAMGVPRVKTTYRVDVQRIFERGMLESNRNHAERGLRFLIAIVLLPVPLVMTWSAYSLPVAAVGGRLRFHALLGAYLTDQAFGVTTCVRLAENTAVTTNRRRVCCHIPA
ncbi:MAG: hypothetical protein VX589_04270 [Myxococcota bacterium]|nr:hypothetical protein [Myxococcota bacterium]